jgi:hypothetical protein
LAVELGILPFDVAYADNAALVCFRRWLMSMGGIMDDVTREALQFMGKVAKNQHKLNQGRIAHVTREFWGFTENGRCYIRKADFDDLVVSNRERSLSGCMKTTILNDMQKIAMSKTSP